MKKIASRILALVVVLSMLLAPTAFAAERNAATLSIGNFSINVNGEDISLPVSLSVGGGVDIEGIRGYLTAGLSTQTATALSALAAFENGEIKAQLSGMEYGFTVPLEQIVTLIEEQLGMTIEEAMMQAMSSIDPEMMNQITGITESAAELEAIDIAPEALMDALGVTLTEQGEAKVSLFTTEVTASATGFAQEPQTVKEMYDALAALDPALADYINEYSAAMNESMAASGEDMTFEEALAMVTTSINGTIYEADCGLLAEMVLTVSVEDETIDIPLNLVTLTDDIGTYFLISSQMDVDGESLFFEFYVDDYFSDGVNQASIIVNVRVGDTDSTENDVELYLYCGKEDSAESTVVRIDLSSTSYGETAAAGFKYTGYPVVSTEDADSYDGRLDVYAESGSEGFFASADTNLTLTNVPAGELLPLAQSINPLEADEDTLNQIASDAQTALFQGLGVLMQDPALSEMISGLMMG